MTDTERLIDSLSASAAPVKPLAGPLSLFVMLGGILVLYAVVMGTVLGLRPDLALQLQRPFFLAEIMLLIALCLSSLWGSAHLVFPDAYQSHSNHIFLPFSILMIFALLLGSQMFLPPDPLSHIPSDDQDHRFKCTLCIASIAVLPSALTLVLSQRGASAHPQRSGLYAVLAATSIGCLMLRLSEANDSVSHLVLWHYGPTLLLAVIGAGLGKLVLKW